MNDSNAHINNEGKNSILKKLEFINNSDYYKIDVKVEKIKNVYSKNVIKFLSNFSKKIDRDFTFFGPNNDSLDPWSDSYWFNNIDVKDNISKINKNVENEGKKILISHREKAIKTIKYQQKNFMKEIYKVINKPLFELREDNNEINDTN